MEKKRNNSKTREKQEENELGVQSLRVKDKESRKMWTAYMKETLLKETR